MLENNNPNDFYQDQNREQLRQLINDTFAQPPSSPDKFPQPVLEALDFVLNELDSGRLRVCEPHPDSQSSPWVVNEWVKKAILLYFRAHNSKYITAGDITFYDKLPLKNWGPESGVRVVPPACARRGSYIAPGAILMPSYVNIGAHVGKGTLVDTWATVGSCAQVGEHVHLSGGVGIGGVLEPLQARPVVIEDHAFIGSRCVIVEGVHIGRGAVLGAGVVLTASTPIIDVTERTARTFKGRVPDRAVVIPGTRNKEFPAGQFNVPCALIIGERTASTDEKTSLNAALRDLEDHGI